MAKTPTWKRDKRATLDCVQCETTVQRQREEQRFCSETCRMAWHRYRDDELTIRLTYAEWFKHLLRTGDDKPLTRDQFRGKIAAQMAQWPLWSLKTADEAAKVGSTTDRRYLPPGNS